MSISSWVMLGPSVHSAYKNRQRDPDDYNGPMDDRRYAILNTFFDNETVQDMYKVKGSGNNAFVVYGLNFDTLEQAESDILFLEDAWPKPQVVTYGAWDTETGLQVGTKYELDDDGEPTDVITGTPTYPIPSDCYKIMPDLVVFGEDGEEISRTPASSNADLRDINLISGASPRIFS